MGRKNKRRKSAYYRKLRMASCMKPMSQMSQMSQLSPMPQMSRSSRISQIHGNTRYSQTAGEEHMDGATQNLQSPRRGEIWFAEFVSHPGTSVQNGKRPALIVSNDMSNQHAETVTVVPMTTRIKKPHLPTHVIATPKDVDTAAGRYIERSMLLCEQVTTIGKCELIRYVGKICNRKLREVEEAVLAQVSIMDASVADEAMTDEAMTDEAMTDASLTADEAVADKITTAEIFEKEG